MRKLLTAILFASLLFPAMAWAQDSARFSLTRKTDGHYYFTAPVCGAEAEIMLESGIPALLVGKDFYESKMKDSGLTFNSSSSNIRLLTNLYNIVFRTTGMLQIGNATYDGPIFILEDYDGIALPIQYLKDSKTKKGIVRIDLKEGYLSVGGNVPDEGKKYKLTFEKDNGRPLVNSNFTIETQEGTSNLKGKLIVDYGNPMLLFLIRQHKSLDKAIKGGKMELKDARNTKGEVVSQGIFANNVKIFGKEYKDISIGILGNYKTNKQLGFLGTPFFQSPVVFDFDHKVMITQ